MRVLIAVLFLLSLRGLQAMENEIIFEMSNIEYLDNVNHDLLIDATVSVEEGNRVFNVVFSRPARSKLSLMAEEIKLFIVKKAKPSEKIELKNNKKGKLTYWGSATITSQLKYKYEGKIELSEIDYILVHNSEWKSMLKIDRKEK